jgi:hypothetical protein
MLCKFISSGDLTGLTYEITQTKATGKTKKIDENLDLYTIIGCHNFDSGPLPTPFPYKSYPLRGSPRHATLFLTRASI